LQILKSLDGIISVELFAILAGLSLTALALLARYSADNENTSAEIKANWLIGRACFTGAPVFFLFGLIVTLAFDSLAGKYTSIAFESYNVVFTGLFLVLGVAFLVSGVGTLAPVMTGLTLGPLLRGPVYLVNKLTIPILEVILPTGKKAEKGQGPALKNGSEIACEKKPAKYASQLLKWGFLWFGLCLALYGLKGSSRFEGGLMWAAFGFSVLSVLLGIELAVHVRSESKCKQRIDRVGYRLADLLSPWSSNIYLVVFVAGFLSKLSGRSSNITFDTIFYVGFVLILLLVVLEGVRAPWISQIIGAVFLIVGFVSIGLHEFLVGGVLVGFAIALLLGVKYFRRNLEFP